MGKQWVEYVWCQRLDQLQFGKDARGMSSNPTETTGQPGSGLLLFFHVDRASNS
jgi:hypothetical protein